ncbi:DNA-directed primase/polymerase protein isoform X2 [Rhincodon typus]|uniref:DNA-directed primase/polymerase protein isoform X2 n=1 Tax=Rhincodon typus TaxID=259920 RepID=UPI00202FB218|nr:DNA-directed primase/polymerase protein isoform X2 [Rhincodon typus]
MRSALLEKSEESNMDPDLSFLIVKDICGRDQLFVDLGVYTKNRNFRLYKSSKLGKNTSFEVAEDNQFVPEPEKNVSREEQFFLSSLVSNVRFCDSMTVLTCDSSDTKETKAWHVQDNPHLSASDMFGYHCSPYPEIDSFITHQVNKGGIQGALRRWNYFSSEELIVYDISKNHWCDNIGRAHKSNNIMIVVDLKKGIWYQKCYDPVCRAQKFRSESHPLPQECCMDFLIDMKLNQVSHPKKATRVGQKLWSMQHNKYTEDAISLALHSSLEHLDNADTYISLLLIDYSSAL